MGNTKEESARVVMSEFYPGEHCEAREKFEKSLFCNAYRSAYKDLQEKIFRQVDSGESLLKEDENDYSDNIITFVGRRGTGKSTVIKSFMKALRENWKSEVKDFTIYRDSTSHSRVKFIDLDRIDASLLEKEEDIFDTILAKMLHKIMKKQEDTGSFSSSQEREVYNQLANIYKKYLNLKMNKNLDMYSEDMAIASLRNLARSSDIRDEFSN